MIAASLETWELRYKKSDGFEPLDRISLAYYLKVISRSVL
jgi:hypothetical protein